MDAELVDVDVAFALSERQTSITLQIHCQASIQDAIEKSGILQLYPEINLEQDAVGIFGKKAGLTDGVQAGDRIEIYRSLQQHPMQARRQRASQQSAD